MDLVPIQLVELSLEVCLANQLKSLRQAEPWLMPGIGSQGGAAFWT